MVIAATQRAKRLKKKALKSCVPKLMYFHALLAKG
jgi:hypothetical protein